MRTRRALSSLLLVAAGVGLTQRAQAEPLLALDPPPGPTSTHSDLHGQGTGWQRLVIEAMHTRVAVTLPDSATATDAARAAFEAVRRVDVEMNEWRPGSPLAEVNRQAGGTPQPVPPGLRAVLRRSIAIGHATGGAFDVTWAALWGLWDFDANPPRLPDPAEVKRRAGLVDFRRIELDEGAGTVRLPVAGMAIGLGGIAKGWALDTAAAELRARGVTDFLLDAGGQLLAGGTHAGQPWQVGVRDPRGKPDAVLARLRLGDESLATSGDYERFFEIHGVRYHHVLDPRTGWPARGLRAVMCVAREAALADAVPKAVMVLGWRRGVALARALGVELAAVDERGRLRMTPGMRQRRIGGSARSLSD